MNLVVSPWKLSQHSSLCLRKHTGLIFTLENSAEDFTAKRLYRDAAIKTQVVGSQHGKLDICLLWDLSCCSLGSVPAGAAQCDGIGCKDKQTVPGLSCWTTVLRPAEVPEERHVTSVRNRRLSAAKKSRELLVPRCLRGDLIYYFAAWNEIRFTHQTSPVTVEANKLWDVWCFGGTWIVLQQMRNKGLDLGTLNKRKKVARDAGSATIFSWLPLYPKETEGSKLAGI